VALGGRYYPCPEDQIADQVIELLHERDLTTIQSWDGDHLPAGLLEALQRKDIQVQISPDAEIKAGLTGALAGAAESGTLVVTAGQGKPLTASLLPELHIAILHASDIYESLSQVLELEAVRKATSSTLISGPSRTADIEMTLTIGVHGPAEVCVLCVT
jgi:L-lactate dehydrogenase complex protein LldG